MTAPVDSISGRFYQPPPGNPPTTASAPADSHQRPINPGDVPCADCIHPEAGAE
jgi:hypothetical protein